MKEKLTKSQAGKLGAKALYEKYSAEERSAISKRAAETIKKTRPNFHAEIGAIGGSRRKQHD